MGSRYTHDQRKEIIRLHTQEGYSTRLLAKKYRIGRTSIQSWLRIYRNETGEAPEPQNRKGVKSSKEATSKKLMLREIEMQLSVLTSFQKELERWDVPK